MPSRARLRRYPGSAKAVWDFEYDCGGSVQTAVVEAQSDIELYLRTMTVSSHIYAVLLFLEIKRYFALEGFEVVRFCADPGIVSEGLGEKGTHHQSTIIWIELGF